jgi:DNA-directed RNA polymerase subunit K
MAKDKIDYTKYEKARMIGSRALQLSMGAPFLVKLSVEELEKIKYDPIEIALVEFDEDVLPITVRRPNAVTS